MASRLTGALALVALAALAAAARATDWDASLDLRMVSANADRSYLDGGLGLTRFDRTDSTLELGRLRLALTQGLGETWSVHLDASVWDDREPHWLGLTEGYLLYRPYPVDGFRLRVKAGAFYAPVSLENRAGGWESPYTLSYSGINSWLATELRTVGTEAQLDWLGTRTGHSFDLALTGAVFGWNQLAGKMLASDGFVFTDRQTPLGGRVGQPGAPPLNGEQPFEQIDHRAGLYGGLELRYFDRLVLRVLRYDNRADPTQMDAVSGRFAWHTSFTSAGARLETQDGWTAIAQWMNGSTEIEPQGFNLTWPFHSAFGLVSRRLGRHTLSARYDHFFVDVIGADGDGWQGGHAVTLAWSYEVNAHWRCALEWLEVYSNAYYRGDIYGASPYATQNQLQFAVRYALGSQVR